MTYDLWASESMVAFGGQFQHKVCGIKGTERASGGLLGGGVCISQAQSGGRGRRPPSQSEGLVWRRTEDTPFSETEREAERIGMDRDKCIIGRDKCTNEGPYRMSKHVRAVINIHNDLGSQGQISNTWIP